MDGKTKYKDLSLSDKVKLLQLEYDGVEIFYESPAGHVHTKPSKGWGPDFYYFTKTKKQKFEDLSVDEKINFVTSILYNHKHKEVSFTLAERLLKEIGMIEEDV